MQEQPLLQALVVFTTAEKLVLLYINIHSTADTTSACVRADYYLQTMPGCDGGEGGRRDQESQRFVALESFVICPPRPLFMQNI